MLLSPLTRPQLDVLGSENRFLAISIASSEFEENEEPTDFARLNVVFDVRESANDGLIGAVWYGSFELVVEYATPSQRDEALRALARKDVRPLEPPVLGGPRLLMSWVIPVFPEDSAEGLASALEDYFEGTGFSSLYTYGRFGCSKASFRIVFHNPPPPLTWVLKGVEFAERLYRPDVVTGDDFRLRLEPLPPSSSQGASEDVRVCSEADLEVTKTKSTFAEFEDESKAPFAGTSRESSESVLLSSEADAEITRDNGSPADLDSEPESLSAGSAKESSINLLMYSKADAEVMVDNNHSNDIEDEAKSPSGKDPNETDSECAYGLTHKSRKTENDSNTAIVDCYEASVVSRSLESNCGKTTTCANGEVSTPSIDRRMDFETSSGIIFTISRLPETRDEMEELSPCKFLAGLLVQNQKLGWASFNISNITEIINFLIKDLKPELLLATQLSEPFSIPIREVRCRVMINELIGLILCSRGRY